MFVGDASQEGDGAAGALALPRAAGVKLRMVGCVAG